MTPEAYRTDPTPEEPPIPSHVRERAFVLARMVMGLSFALPISLVLAWGLYRGLLKAIYAPPPTCIDEWRFPGDGVTQCGHPSHKMELQRTGIACRCPLEVDPRSPDGRSTRMELEGINPASIRYQFEPVPPELTKKSSLTVPDPEARFKAAVPEWIEEHMGGPKYVSEFKWDRHWRDIDYPTLRRVFTEEEIIKLWCCEFIMSRTSAYIEKQEFLIYKTANSHHHYGFGREDYNLLIQHINGLKALVAPPGFEIRLTHSTYFNEVGRAEHVTGKPLFLDGPFGLLFYFNGEHVLTAGFVLGGQGVYLTQVQNREKKGNRWLYKLKQKPIDMCLDVLAKAFPQDALWLVTGASAVVGIRISYGNQPCSMTYEDEERITAHYDQPLERFVRSTEEIRIMMRRRVLRLVPKLG